MAKNLKKTIYLDHASATPVDGDVKKVMKLTESIFANPSAIHKDGLKARKIVEDARTRIAKLIYAHSDEIIFTGSGTESVALAILGLINNFKLQNNYKKKIPHIVTTTIEHPAVLENCKMLEERGKAEVTYIDPDKNGIINPKDIREALKENTVLVSVMYANNEIGTIQPIQEIAKVIRYFRKSGKSNFSGHTDFSAEKSAQAFAPSRSRAPENLLLPLFHTDACQAMNYLPTENIEKLGVDMMSFNSSKIYGPKGIAVLYKKRKVELAPIYAGGGQEFGLRSGTENVSLIAGFGEALAITSKTKERESKRLIKLRDYGIKKLLELSKITGYKIILNGDAVNRLPNNINISISDISSELLVIELDAKGIEVSAKSACKSDEPDESYVITAIRKAEGLKINNTDGSLRTSLGRSTTKQDMDILALSLKQILVKYSVWK